MRRSISKNLPAVILASFIVLRARAEVPEQLAHNVEQTTASTNRNTSPPLGWSDIAMKICKSARLVFAVVAVGFAQQPSAVDDIVDNYSKLASTIELDRLVYFPDEEANLTITVRNPTAGALRVAAPFRLETGSLGLLQQTGTGTWQSVDADAGRELLLNEQTPFVVLNSGEERRISLKSTDAQFGGAKFALLTGSTPSQPGLYQVYYDMGGGRKNFRVVEPFFEAAAQTTLRTEIVVTEGGKTLRLPQYLYAFAARWDGVSYICVAYPTTVGGDSYPRVGQRLTHNHISGLTHKRVLNSTTAIAQLQVAEDLLGNFVITYKDSNAQTGSIRLSATLQPL